MELDQGFKATANVVRSTADSTSAEGELLLFSCPIDEAPESVGHFSVRQEGRIMTKFPNMKIAEKKFNQRLKRYTYQFSYTVEVDLRSEEGVLTFKSLVKGAVAGTTNISFEA
jgi:hypothetical protein